MDKLNKKTLIYAGAGLGTVLIGYFIWDLLKINADKNKYSQQSQKETGGTSVKKDDLAANESSSGTAQSSNDAYPLKIGSYGAKVFVLQEALNKLGAGLTIDGKFGQNTYNAVQDVDFGFGLGNMLCGIDYGCSVSYSNWEKIVNKAKEKGFDVNVSWTRAKAKWKV